MKNISATKGTSLVQIFLMDDRSTAVCDATSTLTPQVGPYRSDTGAAVFGEWAGPAPFGTDVAAEDSPCTVTQTIRLTGRPINRSIGRPLDRSSEGVRRTPGRPLRPPRPARPRRLPRA